MALASITEPSGHVCCAGGGVGAVCEHDGSFGLVLQSTTGGLLSVAGGLLSVEPLALSGDEPLEGADGVVGVPQGGAEPLGHGVGQLPFLSGVEPLSQLDCPGPFPVVEFGPDGADGVGCGCGVPC